MTQEWINVWAFKPWWCQPWSIVLTALGLPAASWLLFHRLWLTGLIAVPLLLWMVFFIGLYPKLAQSLYRQALEQQKNHDGFNL